MFEWLNGWFTPSEKTIETMTKKELEEHGRKHGIELDRRFKKETLVKLLKKKINMRCCQQNLSRMMTYIQQH